MAFGHQDAQIEKSLVNTHCTSHTIVTGALLMRAGASVTTRGGMAFLIDPSPDGNPKDDYLHQIAKHWWLTVDKSGVVDLSLHLQKESPLVYQNRSVGENWPVSFGDKPEKLQAFIKARERGVYYFTSNKKLCTLEDLEQSLDQCFPAAQKRGIQLPYRKIVEHCESLLANITASLIGIPQTVAWERLSY